MPLASPTIEIHGTELTALHEQLPLLVLTLNIPGPPAGPVDLDPGARLKVQPLTCLTVKAWPAIVTVPTRAAAVLASTASLTVPFPDPLAPAVTWIQGAWDDVVHVQPAAAVTLTATLAPAAGTSSSFGAMM